MKLSALFSDLYLQLSQGKEQVVIPPIDAYPVETLANGTKRIRFSANGLEFVADFKDRNFQIDLFDGQPFATLQDGEVVAFESDYRSLLF